MYDKYKTSLLLGCKRTYASTYNNHTVDTTMHKDIVMQVEEFLNPRDKISFAMTEKAMLHHSKDVINQLQKKIIMSPDIIDRLTQDAENFQRNMSESRNALIGVTCGYVYLGSCLLISAAATGTGCFFSVTKLCLIGDRLSRIAGCLAACASTAPMLIYLSTHCNDNLNDRDQRCYTWQMANRDFTESKANYTNTKSRLLFTRNKLRHHRVLSEIVRKAPDSQKMV